MDHVNERAIWQVHPWFFAAFSDSVSGARRSLGGRWRIRSSPRGFDGWRRVVAREGGQGPPGVTITITITIEKIHS